MKADVFGEFVSAVNRMNADSDDYLRSLGIPEPVLFGGPSHVGMTRIEPGDDDLYQPSPDGVEALIVPNGIMRTEGIGWHQINNLLAFKPSDPSRYWQRIGGGVFLNPEAIRRAEHFGELLPVFSTPLRWLQACGQGCVVLDWSAHLPLYFAGIPAIAADSPILASRLLSALDGLKPSPEMHVLKPAEVSHAA